MALCRCQFTPTSTPTTTTLLHPLDPIASTSCNYPAEFMVPLETAVFGPFWDMHKVHANIKVPTLSIH